MTGGVLMREVRYIKPSITNLKGRRGRAIIDAILNSEPKSMDTIKAKAEASMQEILTLKENGK